MDQDEKVFTKANVGKMKLLWKVKLESTPREMHNLFNPLVLQNVTTAQGAREMAVVAGVSDDLFGIDVASGELVWKKHFDGAPAPVPGGRGSSTLCQDADGETVLHRKRDDLRDRAARLQAGRGRT